MKNRHGIGKKVAIFDWEWGRNSAPREGQKNCADLHLITNTFIKYVQQTTLADNIFGCSFLLVLKGLVHVIRLGML